MEVTEEMKETLRGLRTELIASHVLHVKGEVDVGYNEGLSKAVNFIDSYIEGKGLFQYPNPQEELGDGGE